MPDSVTRGECKDKMDKQDDVCKERSISAERDVDKLGESHRQLSDKIDRVEKKIDIKTDAINERFDSLKTTLIIIAFGMIASLFTAVISLLK